ncbi:MAG: tetratricopeptide repeat protein, partial [Planctomycetes bacterium]|nr:tetratricopeptide repeat protein [Planctomycetota bacterium]
RMAKARRMSNELGGVVNATKKMTSKLVMAAAIVGAFVMMSACASGKTIKQGSEEFSIPEDKYFEALELQDDGMYFESIRAWTEVLDSEPRFAQGHFNLGLIYDQLNLVPEATQHYELAVQYAEGLKPDESLYNLHLGAAYLRSGLVDEAIEALKQALTDDPYNATIHYNLSAAYMARKNYDNALLEADTAVDLLAQPDAKRADGLNEGVDRTRLGNYLLRQAACHIAREEWDKARAGLERAEKQCGTTVPAEMWEQLDAATKPMEPEEGGEEG